MINSINSKTTHVVSFITIITTLLIFPYLLDFADAIDLNSGCKNKSYMITADSLITTATVTMIVFTNFSPNSSSGSSSIIRRAYWRSSFLTTNARMYHKFLWVLSSSFLLPSRIIGVTLLTTIIEVCLLLANQSTYLVIGMLLITSLMMMTSLFRFIIFHLYTNKNVAIWMIEKMKNNKEFLNSKSLYLDTLSYFRTTANFELVYVILKRFGKERVSISKITNKAIDRIKKDDIPKSTEGIMHPLKETNVLNQELLILNIFVFNLMSNKKIYAWDRNTKTTSEKWKILEKYLMNFYERRALQSLSVLSFDKEASFTDEKPSSPTSTKKIKELLKNI